MMHTFQKGISLDWTVDWIQGVSVSTGRMYRLWILKINNNQDLQMEETTRPRVEKEKYRISWGRRGEGSVTGKM